MKTLGKQRKKQWVVYSLYQWENLIPIGGIKIDTLQQNKMITVNSSVCVYLNEVYYGLDLFKGNTIQDLKNDWSLLYLFDNKLGIVLRLNSIRDKYMIGICRFE